MEGPVHESHHPHVEKFGFSPEELTSKFFAILPRRFGAYTSLPIRIPPSLAAAVLSIHYETVRKLITRGVFTAIRPNGKGIGKRIYVLPEEVAAYAIGGAKGVEEYREERRRKAAERRRQAGEPGGASPQPDRGRRKK